MHLVEHSDPSAVPDIIVPFGPELEAFRGIRKGEPPVYLIFCRGPFSEKEITLLAVTKAKKDKRAIVEAQRNLDVVRADKRRRRYESIIGRAARVVRR
jgi:hypothetical protein